GVDAHQRQRPDRLRAGPGAPRGHLRGRLLQRRPRGGGADVTAPSPSRRHTAWARMAGGSESMDASELDLQDVDGVLQAVRFQLYRENIYGALEVVERAHAAHPDPR